MHAVLKQYRTRPLSATPTEPCGPECSSGRTPLRLPDGGWKFTVPVNDTISAEQWCATSTAPVATKVLSNRPSDRAREQAAELGKAMSITLTLAIPGEQRPTSMVPDNVTYLQVAAELAVQHPEPWEPSWETEASEYCGTLQRWSPPAKQHEELKLPNQGSGRTLMAFFSTERQNPRSAKLQNSLACSKSNRNYRCLQLPQDHHHTATS